MKRDGGAIRALHVEVAPLLDTDAFRTAQLEAFSSLICVE